MTYRIFNTNDPDIFESVSSRINIDNFDKITAFETTRGALELLRYLAEYAEVYSHRFSAFEPMPRYALPLQSENPKIFVTTLHTRLDHFKLEIYIPKTLVEIAVYVKLKYGSCGSSPSSP